MAKRVITVNTIDVVTNSDSIQDLIDNAKGEQVVVEKTDGQIEIRSMSRARNLPSEIVKSIQTNQRQIEQG